MFARKKFSENQDPLQRGSRVKKVQPAAEVPVKPGVAKLKRPAVAQTKRERAAFGDLTNATKENDAVTKKVQSFIKPPTKANTGVVKPAVKNQPTEVKKAAKENVDAKKVTGLIKPTIKPAAAVVKPSKIAVKKQPAEVKKKAPLKTTQEVSTVPLESSQALNNLAAGVPVDRQEEDFSFIVSDDVEDDKENLLSVDKENYSDVFNIGIYAQDIFDYYKRREKMFEIPDYLCTKQKSKITPIMRAILVDWMVEIQENFELNHETLYLAVKLSDTFMSRKPQDKEQLQLVGAASVFIAAKFDERCPPLIEDFTYICDNTFDADQFLQMEMEILRKVDFDLGIPISYRFLRRFAKVARSPLVTLTLARYILELSLMEYSLIRHRDSVLAAAALYIAMKMSKEGEWEGEVVQSSGYTVDQLKEAVLALNKMLHAQPAPQLNTIRSKYSHIVFHEVAKIKVLPSSELL